MSEQLTLDIPRKRVMLADAPQQGEVAIRPRVRLEDMPKPITTGWMLGSAWKPYHSGFYDLHILGTTEMYRAWFEADADEWMLADMSRYKHAAICMTIEFRGLLEPAACGYDWPMRRPRA